MKSKFTKLLALLMALTIVFSLAACGKDTNVTTSAEVTTAADETKGQDDATTGVQTTASETTTAPGDTTAVGQTATTTATVTKPESKTEILDAYTAVMNKAKTDKPGFKKYEYQALPEDKRKIDGAVINTLLDIVSKYMTTKEKAQESPSVYAKGDEKAIVDNFPVKKSSKGCMLTDVSAIYSAKCDVLSNGNYQITIVLNSEKDPEHYESGTTAPSKTGAMFTPLSKSDINPELEKYKLIIRNAVYTMTFYDCTSTLVYNPKTSQVVSVDQVTHTTIDMSGKVIGLSTQGSADLEMYYSAREFVY